MSNLEELCQLRDDWRSQRDRLDEQIGLIEQLLATFDADAPAPPVVVAVAETPGPSPTTKPKKAAQVACPDCGLMCTPGTGLGVHRKRKHPGSAAKPVTLEPAPGPALPHIDPEPLVKGKVFVCDDCDEFEAPNIKMLQRHTWDSHQRPLLSVDERRPVDSTMATAS